MSPHRNEMWRLEYGVAAYAEVHLAFDSFPVLQLCFPIDLRLSPKHDCSDERISSVWTLDTAGPQVSFGFEPFAAFTVIELSARGELSNELFVIGNNDLPAFDELADG